jgi:hypothetical protein
MGRAPREAGVGLALTSIFARFLMHGAAKLRKINTEACVHRFYARGNRRTHLSEQPTGASARPALHSVPGSGHIGRGKDSSEQRDAAW